MAELLLELFSEEIPARMQAKAADDLRRLVEEGLKKAGLAWTRSEAFVTPRRLTLVIDGLPEKQSLSPEPEKGPKVGSPDQALQGFLKKVGLDESIISEIKTLSMNEGRKFIGNEGEVGIIVKDLAKGPTYVAEKQHKDQAAVDVLPGLLDEAFNALPWPKSMKWGQGQKRWVRPLHNILALFGGQVLPVAYENVKASQHTFGHRFLSPGPIAVTDFADYRAKLAAAHVMLCPSERRAEIVSQAEALAERAGLTLKPDEGLLQEVTGLVEWPVVLMGAIDDEFMDVPAEVLTTTMRVNQKYFTLLNADGSLAPRFIVVANQQAGDGGQAIVAGNERVLRARLSDAKFFWDQDRKDSLASRAPRLKDIVFHAKLGTVEDKVSRIAALADQLAGLVGADKSKAIAAAELCKADLVTGMVGEFPELQGVMGRYYALKDGESAEVADAIRDHYSPLGPNDACPKAPVSVAVALADKIDTLLGFWTIDEKPTGSKDPFALRRAALGVIRLIIENKLRLSLRKILGVAYDLREDIFSKGTHRHTLVNDDGTLPPSGDGWVLMEHHAMAPKSEAVDDLLSFFADRLKVHLKGEGVRHDLIDAVFSLGGEDDLVRLLARVDALSNFLKTDDGANLLAAHKRAANILRIEEKKDGRSYAGAPDAKHFQQDEERALASALSGAGAEGQALARGEKFEDAMAALARLRAPLDAFFDAVMVNADDKTVRENRLKLLSQILTVTGDIADFSKIEG